MRTRHCGEKVGDGGRWSEADHELEKMDGRGREWVMGFMLKTNSHVYAAVGRARRRRVGRHARAQGLYVY